MRVLLAIDGSTASASATQLAGSLEWPDGTVIEVVAVVEPATDFVGTTVTPMLPTGRDLDRQVTDALNVALDDAATTLGTPNRRVSRALLKGRPATEIVAEASAFRADLVVVGSRGFGPLTSMLLGSVSAEVVDHAPCPVLVVRKPSVGSILVGVDGSPAAQAAVTFLTAMPALAHRHVEVLGVVKWTHALPPTATTGPGGLIDDPRGPAPSAERRRAEDVAARAAEALQTAGGTVRWSVSKGDPAHEIIEAATSFGSGLVVLGSRGLTGMTRLLLGSVARNVLLHTQASVLIVHASRVPQAETEYLRGDTAALAAWSAPH